jgi:S1-C subfamily serine protease
LTAIDLIIVAFALVMAVWGYYQGLLVGALSLVGFAGGAFVGSRVGPLLLEQGARSPYAPLVTLLAALLVGGMLATIGETIGRTLKRRLSGRLGALDGAAGALLVGAVGLLLAWIGGAAFLQAPGARAVRDDIQRSRILQALNRTLPPSGPILNALARFDPLPEIDAPRAKLPPPPPGIARDPDVEAAGGSVVRVVGTACGLAMQGSGWVAGDGVVVTNAHVVAGQEDTTVQVAGEGSRYEAEAIHFDPRNDLAILRAIGVEGVPPLSLNDAARAGSPAAVLGFPLDGPFAIEPGRLGDTITATSQDAYGRGSVRREITQLRAEVQSGNSGGPMVDDQGGVVTTVFAASTGAAGNSGYGIPDRIVADALDEASRPVSTGPCAA